MIIVSLLYYYFGAFRNIFLISYLISFKSFFRRKITLLNMILIFYIIFIFFLNFYRSSAIVSIFYVRLFWGVFFFYLYFSNNPQKKSTVTKVIYAASLITIIEYILIHIYPSLIFIIPNYVADPQFYEWFSNTGYLSGALSFGGNRTVTGVILLAFHVYSIQNNLSTKLITFIALVFSVSTSAYILYFVYHGIRKLSPIMISVISFTGYIILNSLNDIYYRLSFDYLFYLFTEFKFSQIQKSWELLNFDNMTFYLGNLDVKTESEEVAGFGLHFGDFLMLDYFTLFGWIGLLFFFVFYFTKFNSSNWLPLLLILIGTFHYHVIFSFPGQIITGYFLSLKNNK